MIDNSIIRLHIDVDTLGLLFDRKTERTKIIGELDDLPSSRGAS